jgi:hypothetical protein
MVLPHPCLDVLIELGVLSAFFDERYKKKTPASARTPDLISPFSPQVTIIPEVIGAQWREPSSQIAT